MSRNAKPLDRMSAETLIRDTLSDVTLSQAQRMVSAADISILAKFSDVTITKTPKGYLVEFPKESA